MDKKETMEIINRFWKEHNETHYDEYGNNFDKYGGQIINNFIEYCEKNLK